jgi:membrane protein
VKAVHGPVVDGHRMKATGLLSIAGGVSFFVLLAIFPAITALVSAYGLFFNPARIVNDIGQLRDLVPAIVLTIVHGPTC